MSISLPPKPSGSGFGHLFRFARNPFEFLKEAYLECGDVFVLDMPIMGRYICIASPELSRVVYSQPDEVFSAGLIHDRLAGGLLGSSSTMVVDGETHRYRQGLIIKHLNGPYLASYMEMMHQVAHSHIASHLDGEVFSCQDFAGQFSLEVIGRVFFGLEEDAARLDPLLGEFRDFTNQGIHSIWAQLPRFQKDLGPWSPWGRILRMEARVRRNFLEKVARRRAETGGPSICASLIEAGLSNDEIVDELFALLFAGHETTRNTLTWSIYYIMTHPGLRERLTAEVDHRIADRPIENDDLAHLPSLTSLIHEVLRASPIGPFLGGRIARRDFELGNYLIRAGEAVAFCGYTMWQREDVWKDAARFDPNRFVEKTVQSSPDHFPFGRGRRICTGRGVALQESLVMLSTLLQETAVEVHPSEAKVKARGVMLGTPLGGLPISLKKRQLPRTAAPQLAPVDGPDAASHAAPQTCPFHHANSSS